MSPRHFARLVFVSFAVLGVLYALVQPVRAADDATKADARPAALFDGKSFDGWEGNLDVFRIEDGAIVGGSLKKNVARNEFLCTQKEYGDFELRLKFKLLGKGANAGVQIRTKRIPNHHEVSGYQADLGDGYWGALYDESRRNKILATPKPDALDKVLKRDDWNDYRIRCEGKRIQLWVNGVQTVDYTEADKDIAERGVIAVQIHGGSPSEAWYKDITIVELSAAK
ncbi:MAG: DUF1080 domain-containing protein [Pirellulales bacterium]